MAMRSFLAGAATCLALFGQGSASAQSPSPVAGPAPRVDQLTQLTLDSIAGRFAALELERPTLLIRWVPEHSEVRALDQRRQVLCEMVHELAQGTANTRKGVSAHVARVIEERLAALAIDRRLLIARHHPAHSDVRALEGVIAALQGRRSELQAAEGQGLCATSAGNQERDQ